MSAFLLPAQAAIYARLVADVTSATVYDDVPDQPDGMPDDAFPYIVIGEDTAQDWDTDDTLGSQVNCTIHVWSIYQGKKEVKEIMGEIYNSLHRNESNFSAAGYRFVDSLLQFSEVIDEDDGATRHGICRYLVTIERI